MISLHDIIVDELLKNKALSALIFLIDSGRELEFEYKDEQYFISRHTSKKYVSLWHNSDEQSFNNVYELIENAELQDKLFVHVWNEFKLLTLM